MRTTIYVALAAAAVACSRGQELTQDQTAQIQREVLATLRDAYDLSKPKPVERMMSLYPTTVRVISANTGRAMTSRDSINAAVEQFWQAVGVNMKQPRFEWVETYVDVLSPTAAVVTATYRIPHLNPNNQPHTLGGAMTVVFQKRDGKWVVIQEHLSDLPQGMTAAGTGHDH
jgi:ketosteroid isomerase-like protein